MGKKKLMSRGDRLNAIYEIICSVDDRCSAVDGPVTPTLQEMTQKEMSAIYYLARPGDCYPNKLKRMLL